MRSFKVTIEMLEPMFSRWREWRLGKMEVRQAIKPAISLSEDEGEDGVCRYRPNEDIDAIGSRPWIHLWMVFKAPRRVREVSDTRRSNCFSTFWRMLSEK